MSNKAETSAPQKQTPLYEHHVAAGAKMVAFAGYDMPVHYPAGVLQEHLWTRKSAGLFDVSHMGQAVLIAADGHHETVSAAFEALVPADILGLEPGQMRYTQLLAADGGILDDLMVTRPANPDHCGGLVLVVNGARKDADFAHITNHLPSGVHLALRPDSALLALQGPSASDVLARHVPAAARLRFMTSRLMQCHAIECLVSRSGYTGEDGYEIVVPSADVGTLWSALAAEPEVAPIGLGARDSLRLEAGLCLYGHDIDETTSPVEAALSWSIQKRRRAGLGFPGADRIMSEMKEGPRRRRIGIRPEGRAPAREGTEILNTDGQPIGFVTSGGFSPTLNAPVAMGYVDTRFAANGTPLQLVVRGKPLPARAAPMPFVPHRYVRAT